MLSAWQTASLPEMSTIIRICASPDSGSAKPHFMKREDYVLIEENLCTQVRPVNSATLQSHCQSSAHSPPTVLASFSIPSP